MKKLALLILIATISHPMLGQWERTQKLGIHGGYEWNVFQNPFNFQRDGELLNRTDLWDNATYQAAFLNSSLKRDWGDQRLKIDLNVSGGLYQTRLSANRYAYKVGVSYRTKYAKKKYFEFAPVLTRIKRDGLNEADAILRTPFSYTQLVIPVSFDFYLGKKAWLKTEAGYMFKNYDRQNGEELFYHAPFANLSFSKKWEAEKTIQKLTFRTGVQLRSYTDIERPAGEDFEEDELIEKSRSWNYFRHSLEYDISAKNDQYSLTFGLYQTTRTDADETNAYQELAPGVKFTYELNPVRFSGGLKYAVRNYPELTPGAGNSEDHLQYKYLRGNIKAEFPLKSGATFFMKGNLINRVSSNTDVTSRAFRGYFNSYFETGLIIRF